MTTLKSDPTRQYETPWRHLAADAAIWAVLVLLLVAFRGFLLWVFRAQLSPDVGVQSLLRCFGTGLRYDLSIASYAMIPSVLMTTAGFMTLFGAWHARVRMILAAVALTAFAVAFVTDVAYFAEYQNQFDEWIFGLVYDDRRAIIQTIWKTYPVVWLALGTLAAVAVSVVAVRKLCRAVIARFPVPGWLSARFWRVLTPVLLIVLMVLGGRGSLGRRPIQLKDAATTGDAFLNKLVLNPFAALRYAVHQHRLAHSTSGLQRFLPDMNVEAAVRALYPQATNTSSLDDCVTQVAPGTACPRPSHIFVVVMESYDAWPMQPKYAEWALTRQLTQLANEGVATKAFVPAATGTIGGLIAIITGLPDAGVNANYQPSLRRDVPTSIAPIFRRLGYRTRFFYGGYLSWERLGDFCREQGFDEVYGGDQMSAKLTGNEWGVDDEVLFRFILDRTTDEPTFNLVMSTSYHPPFSVDLKAKGLSEESVKKIGTGLPLSYGQKRIYGHLWYADRCLGGFVSAAERQLDQPLFAVTGDHYSRRFPAGQRPTLFESKAVPFVLYGRKVLATVKRPRAMAGSHLDIAPTLINLVAPQGFHYHSFGHDMLEASQPQLGFGAGVIVGPEFILEENSDPRTEDFEGHPANPPFSLDQLQQQYHRLQALGWWRVMKGSALLPMVGGQSR